MKQSEAKQDEVRLSKNGVGLVVDRPPSVANRAHFREQGWGVPDSQP